MNTELITNIFYVITFGILFVCILFYIRAIKQFNKRIAIIDQAFLQDHRYVQALIDMEEYE